MTDNAQPKTSVERRLVVYGGIITGALLVNQALVFLLLPLYAHKLGSVGLGVIELTNVTRRVLAVVFLQGLGIAWFRLRVFQKGEGERRTFEATVIWYLMASGIALTGVLSLLGDDLWRFIAPGVPFFPYGLLTVCTAATAAFPTLLERTLQARQQPARLAVFSVGRTLLTLGLIVWFVVGLEHGALGKVQAEAIAGGVLALWALFWLRPAPPTQMRLPQLRSALGYGLPQSPQAITSLVNDMLDRVFLSAALGLAATGVYSVGYRIATVSVLLMGSVHQAFSPLFTDDMHEAEEKERAGDVACAEKIRADLAGAGLGMLVLACVLTQGVSATGREVIEIVAPNQASGAWPVIGPVSMGAVAWCCHRMFVQSVFYDLRASRLVVLIGILGAVGNAVANMLFIPMFGLMGAAWATLTSNALFAVMSYRVGMHYTRVPYALGKWLRVIAWTGVCVAAFQLCDAAGLTVWMRIGLKALGLGVALGGTAVLSGMSFQTLRRLRKKLSR